MIGRDEKGRFTKDCPTSFKQGYDPKGIAAELKLHPFVVKMTMQQCRHFTEEALLTALMEIGELNKGLRKGGRDFPLFEEILIKLLS